MAEEEKKENFKEMSTNDFAKRVAGNYQELKKSFCFILGAGASRSAGIPTATELMKEWRKELMLRSPESRIKMAKAAKLKSKDYKHIFNEDYKVQPADYFALFSLFFSEDNVKPYDYLERMIKCTGPSYGHYKLRDLLTLTRNRFIITTNFDPLVEQALDFCGDRSLLIPHENLAEMIPAAPDKPVIIKLHRDLLYQPMKTKKEMTKLKPAWKGPLTRILTGYTPIVIGYGGEDNTLMHILERMNKIQEMYWCNPEPPGEQVLLRLKNWDVYWVKDYFDNVIDYLHMEFNKQNLLGSSEKPQNIPEKIEGQAKSHIEQYETTDIKRTEELVDLAFRSEEERKSIIELLENRAQKQSDRPENKYIEAHILMLKGEHEAALGFLDELIKKQPEEAIYHFARGNALYHLERNEEAIESYNKAIELDPNDADYYYKQGAALSKLGRHNEALESYNKAVELDPTLAIAYGNRGTALANLGRYEEAIESYNKAIELNSQDAASYTPRGIALGILGYHDEAVESFNKAIELNPQDANAYYNCGIALAKLGRSDDAIDSYNKVIELDPKNANTYYHQGTILDDLDRYDEALESYNKAIELDPTSAIAYYNQGSVLTKMKRYEEALESYNKAIELNPTSAIVYSNQGIVLAELGQFNEALASINKAMELDPANERYQMLRDMIEVDLNNQ